MGNATSLIALDVSYNQLSSEIPTTLGLCLSLNKLNIQHNFFAGDVPDLTLLRGLEHLDLSNNNLTGQIPGYLAHFPSLLYANLSYNSFEGEVPVEGVFKNGSLVQVNGNKEVCGGILELNLKPCLVKKPRRSTRHVNLKVILPLGLVSACLLLLSLLFLCRKWLPREVHSSASSFRRRYPKVSYEELHNATRSCTMQREDSPRITGLVLAVLALCIGECLDRARARVRTSLQSRF